MRPRKSLEMGGEERRKGRERKEGGNREARPPCGRLATEAIFVARRREEGEREVEEEDIFLLLPLTRACQERSESLLATENSVARERERLAGERREGESENLPLFLPHARVREEEKERRKRGEREEEREKRDESLLSSRRSIPSRREIPVARRRREGERKR